MSQSTSTSSNLVDINSATLGAKMPEVTLPDGSKVQTGTVGALILNIKAYDLAIANGDEVAKAELEPRMRAAVPLLKKAGMLDLFPPNEWITGGGPGRVFVGKLAKEFLENDGRA